ncbi:tetratricopeptide repeat protein [Pseudanabaena sp. Chao 1811]|uniref:tetratricopeptide repeat protein n=1 Tax=Pseudanabaena sp. Chao 1811 TaxID=2963092 RepID=UPI0022F3C2C7|nr:tetratricopeptide repeat protein [Pseudanabaena sp. Chao 1811]
MIDQEEMYLQDSTVVEGSQFEHSLVVKDPEGMQGILLDDRFYKIGRSPKNDIVLRSQLVSREHATLTGILTDPPLFQMFRLSDGDLETGKSTNGLHINGERRDNWVLMHGDEIVFSSDTSAYYRIEPEPPYVNGKIDIFLDCLKKLAKTYIKARNYTNAAEGTLQQILVLTEQFYGKDHPNVANCLIDLAIFYYSQNNFTKAEPLFLQAISLRRKVLGEEHLDVASVMFDLAAIYNAQNLHTKAESIFLQALEIKQKLLGDHHPEIAAHMLDLAAIYYAQKRYQEVKNLYEKALKIHKRSLANDHPNIINIQKKLANIKKKLRPAWLSWQVLVSTALILITGGGIAYTFIAPKADITCVKVLPDGKTKSISAEECRQISK